jgi:hypothetical protein
MDMKESVCLRPTVNSSAFLSHDLNRSSIPSTSVILLDLSMPVLDGRQALTSTFQDLTYQHYRIRRHCTNQEDRGVKVGTEIPHPRSYRNVISGRQAKSVRGGRRRLVCIQRVLLYSDLMICMPSLVKPVAFKTLSDMFCRLGIT